MVADLKSLLFSLQHTFLESSDYDRTLSSMELIYIVLIRMLLCFSTACRNDHGMTLQRSIVKDKNNNEEIPSTIHHIKVLSRSHEAQSFLISMPLTMSTSFEF